MERVVFLYIGYVVLFHIFLFLLFGVKMTVKELIEQLNNLDQNKEIVYVDEYNYIQPIIHVDTIERAGNNFVRLY